MKSDEEASTSEITILPDGRVLVFGASDRLIGILSDLNPRDAAIRSRVALIESDAEKPISATAGDRTAPDSAP